ncbi:hypothetical protein AAMO2058_000985800 [Amorphochlora amoebiformis]
MPTASRKRKATVESKAVDKRARSGPATRSRSAGRTPSRSTRSTSQNRRTRRRSPEISKRLKELRYPINDMNGRVFILGLIREEEEEDVGNGDFVDPALLEDVEVEAEVVDKKLAATESFGDASATGSFGDASEVVLSSSKKPMSSFYWGIIVLLLCIMDIPLARVHYFKEISVITEAKSDLNVTMTEFMNETGAEAVDCIQLVQLDIGEETDEYCKVFCTEVKKLSEMRDQARDYVRDEHFYGGLAANLQENIFGSSGSEKTCDEALESVDRTNYYANKFCAYLTMVNSRCESLLHFSFISYSTLQGIFGCLLYLLTPVEYSLMKVVVAFIGVLMAYDYFIGDIITLCSPILDYTVQTYLVAIIGVFTVYLNSPSQGYALRESVIRIGGMFGFTHGLPTLCRMFF